MEVKKGETISEFIRRALEELAGKDYKDLENAPVEGFMVVKGDYILSSNDSFFDLQNKQAKMLRDLEQNLKAKFEYEQHVAKFVN
mmetsp:Transcript_12315/g.8966  ORF Transcript_12315/g.8966 Transcript_12315/m.8966 type:complete len:85 (+) Transcript_12315:286-540(+)